MNLSRSQMGYPASPVIGTIEYMILAFLLLLVSMPMLESGLIKQEDSTRYGSHSLAGLGRAESGLQGVFGKGFLGFCNVVAIPDIGSMQEPLLRQVGDTAQLAASTSVSYKSLSPILTKEDLINRMQESLRVKYGGIVYYRFLKPKEQL